MHTGVLRGWAGLAIFAACVGSAGCGGTPLPCNQGQSAATPSAHASSDPNGAAPAAGVAPALVVRLHPSPSPQGRVLVHVDARSAIGGPLTTWSMTASARASLEGDVVFRDGDGVIAATWKDAGVTSTATLARAPSGDVVVEYAVRAIAPAYPTPPSAMVDPDHFDAAGESVLLLPDAIEDKGVPTSIEIETDEIGSKEFVRAASSFGFGAARETVATGRALRSANYVAALMGKAIFEGPEGADEAVWMGYTAFDPRPASADMAGFRTAMKEMFKPSDGTLATLFFLADARPTGAFLVTRRTRGVVIRVGPAETWSGPMRIAAAAALLHEWIGDRLWVGPADAAHAGEAYWFSEGVTRGLARDLLFRFGLLTPGESAAEMEGLAAVVATSPRASDDNALLGAAIGEPGVVPLLSSRGALYAARIDGLVRKKSGGARSLVNVVTELYKKAASAQAALPTSAWVDAVRAELGDAEANQFTSMIVEGKTIDVPDGSIGPCFQRVQRTYSAFSLGFDWDATKRHETRRLQGLDPKGPAARAGAQEGDELVRLDVTDGRTDEMATLRVRRGDKEIDLRYLPIGATGKGFGWNRKKDVPDEKCGG